MKSKGNRMSHLSGMQRLLCLLVSLMFICNATAAQDQDKTLAKLQRDFAMRYLEPEPHLALARYYFDHGDRLEAFFISEAARRTRFEENIFNLAFYRAFGGFDNSKPVETKLLKYFAQNPHALDTLDGLADIYISRQDYAEAKRYLLLAIQEKPEEYRFTAGLAEVLRATGREAEGDQLLKDYVRKFPETVDGYALRAEALSKTKPAEARAILSEGLKRFPTDGSLLFALGVSYQVENKEKAEQAFVKAAESSPKSETIQTWVGRFFFKIKGDNRRALEYYLRAYFLNPHAYETEFVESRIAKIAYELASEKLAKSLKAGASESSLLADPDPLVVSLALERLAEKWSPDYVKPVVALMGHYNQGVRWQATEILRTRVDASFDEQLNSLLQDEDLPKRGLAAYLAVFRWQARSFDVIRSFLAHDSELLRFDAISALMINGGSAGRQIAMRHAAHEPNAVLKKIILTSKPERE